MVHRRPAERLERSLGDVPPDLVREEHRHREREGGGEELGELADERSARLLLARGPAQTIPAARSGIYGAMCLGGRVLLEPLQKVTVNVPQEILANATRELQRRRGEILDMTSVGDLQTIVAKVPVAEMFGFASDIRSATAGKVLWATESMGFEVLPQELQLEIVGQVRQRRGLKPEPYDAAYYSG